MMSEEKHIISFTDEQYRTAIDKEEVRRMLEDE